MMVDHRRRRAKKFSWGMCLGAFDFSSLFYYMSMREKISLAKKAANPGPPYPPI